MTRRQGHVHLAWGVVAIVALALGVHLGKGLFESEGEIPAIDAPADE
ncbi:MAG: hypothetical protein ACR2RE_00725 [Geminicoccaceae bacterium]